MYSVFESVQHFTVGEEKLGDVMFLIGCGWSIVAFLKPVLREPQRVHVFALSQFRLGVPEDRYKKTLVYR